MSKLAVTTAVHKLLALKKRYKFVQGGTSASKTFSIIMILIDKAQNNQGLDIDVFGQTVPHLKDGPVKDFKTILREQNYWKDDRYNSTDRIYTFETGSTISFKAIDKLGKAKGPRRDISFFNEANELEWNIVEQLMARTRGDVWFDWNPSSEFWYHEHIKEEVDHDFIILNYLDNEALDDNTIQFIESKKNNKNWWRVYGLGLLGEIEGRIYKGWKTIDEIPHEARLIGRGLDFGYTNDPTTIVDVYTYNGGYILDERCYRRGMSNSEIAKLILSFEDNVTVIADSSEPKSIDEIYSYGVPIIGAVKGQGSINRGIAFVQDQPISVTRRSINLRKEYNSYLWKKDPKTGNFTNVPEGGLDHALDAVRYILSSFKPKKTFTKTDRLKFNAERLRKNQIRSSR